MLSSWGSVEEEMRLGVSFLVGLGHGHRAALARGVVISNVDG